MEVAKLLEKEKVDAEVINARFLKPLDTKTILNSIRKTKKAITIEDGLLKGGLASAVIEAINNSDIKDVKVKTFGYDDCFIKHGDVKDIEKNNNLDAENITKNIKVLQNSPNMV